MHLLGLVRYYKWMGKTFMRTDTGRASGLTAYVRNGGDIETARKMANHRSSRTTNMYIRVDDEMRQAEVEKVRF